MRCDLHIHSCYSDGTKTPAELVDIAIANNVGAIALTDHNTIEGLEEFMEYANNKKIDAIPGVEISTEYNGVELHIVGLFISRFHLNSVRKYLAGISKRKEESNIKLVAELAKLGYEIDYEKLRAEHTGSINRAVIAAEMMRKGYINSIKEAFDTILSEKNGIYVPPKRIDSLDTIEFLNYINAIPVLAHPLISMSKEELEEFLPQAKLRGLVAMETIYSEYLEEETLLAKELANKYELRESGGSDYHGDNKPDIQLGTGLGSLYVPIELANELKGGQM